MRKKLATCLLSFMFLSKGYAGDVSPTYTLSLFTGATILHESPLNDLEQDLHDQMDEHQPAESSASYQYSSITSSTDFNGLKLGYQRGHYGLNAGFYLSSVLIQSWELGAFDHDVKVNALAEVDIVDVSVEGFREFHLTPRVVLSPKVGVSYLIATGSYEGEVMDGETKVEDLEGDIDLSGWSAMLNAGLEYRIRSVALGAFLNNKLNRVVKREFGLSLGYGF